jgi:predicted nuclease of predicted toxin-antitoxin system
VKLLLDENLSDRIISRVVDLFPDSTHIKAVGLREAEDFVVWELFGRVLQKSGYARVNTLFCVYPIILWKLI